MKDSTTEPLDWDAVEDLWKKLMLVCDRHRIELIPDKGVPWRDLAIALLLEREPSSRSLYNRGKRGRPRDWKRDIALVLDADHVIGERRCSDSEAVRILTRSPRFVQRWKGENERTLRNRLSAARKDERMAAMLQGAHKAAHDRGLILWEVINQAEAYQFKKRGRPPKKASAAGQKIEGATPDEAKARKVAIQPLKPPAPKPDVAEVELTNADLEVIRQARALFL